ncbi:unnamed protein product [Closterium sp. Yama58-4]|nr:unnamed protein product [Closterium sp. Yama58-4]
MHTNSVFGADHTPVLDMSSKPAIPCHHRKTGDFFPEVQLTTTIKLIEPSATNRPDSASIAQDKEKASANISVGALMNEAEATEVENAWEALMRWGKFWRVKETSNTDEETTKVVIFGGGAFGTALAHMLARNNAELDVVILHRFEEDCKNINELHCNSACHPGIILPDNVRATTNPKEAITGAQYAIHAIPVQPSAAFLQSIAQYVPPTLPILCVSKGLELGTMEMMTEVIPRGLGNPRQPVVILSGPTFAVEIIRELPTGESKLQMRDEEALVAASKDLALAKRAQKLLASKTLRVNTTTDVVGVEMAGALKNVLAIAAGIVEGMQLGNNCMAALVAQGCSEIRWLAEKMGAKSTTLAGLSGTGDIMLTCFVSLSRNRTVGVRLGSGEKLEDILASMTQVAEGVATSGAVISLARKYRVQMPVLTAVARILEGKLEPKEAVMELMSLPQVEEK